MARRDRINDFITELYRGGKHFYSKQEIVAEAARKIAPTEGYRYLFEQIPDHEYDEADLRSAIGGLLARQS